MRLPPISPPPLPSFAHVSPGTMPRPGSMPGSGRDASSPGFSLNLPSAIQPGQASSGASPVSSGGLANMLANQVKGVNSAQTGADAMVHSLITGGDVNEAEVLTAVQKADLAFRMLMQIRNKLMDAYREVQQIQI